MICYCASGDVLSAATKTFISILSTSTRRPRLKQVIISSPDTPNDQAAKFVIRRFTADGTGSAGTTFQADVADGAPICTTKTNYTVEPIYTSGNIEEISVNQRATAIWEPPGDESGDVVGALGAGNGIGIQMASCSLVGLKFNVSVAWEE